jgi:hypothetical protein
MPTLEYSVKGHLVTQHNCMFHCSTRQFNSNKISDYNYGCEKHLTNFWFIVSGRFVPIHLIIWRKQDLEHFCIGQKTCFPFISTALARNQCHSDKFVGNEVRDAGKTCVSSYIVRYFVRFEIKLELQRNVRTQSPTSLSTHSGKEYNNTSIKALIKTSYEAQANTKQ